MDAALAGLPADFPHNGLVYKVVPRTIGAELLYQTWLEGEAYKVLLRHRERMGEADFAAAVANWVRDCAAGLYEWESEVAWRRLDTPAGREKILFLKINEGAADYGGTNVSEEEVRGLRVKHPQAWATLLGIMERQDFPELAAKRAEAEAKKKGKGRAEAPDPNAKSPAPAAG